MRVRSDRIRDAVERAYAQKYPTPGSRKYKCVAFARCGVARARWSFSAGDLPAVVSGFRLSLQGFGGPP